LQLKCDEPLSNFAFNFSVRRYMSAHDLTRLEAACPWEAVARGRFAHDAMCYKRNTLQ
jgi:hypothetical protein